MKKEKWLNIWKVMYNPTGWGAIPKYFNNKEEAEKFAERDYADNPVRVQASNGEIIIEVYKKAEDVDKGKFYYECI